MKKKIGIDISSISNNKNGISRYTYSLVSELIKYNSYEFYLFSNKKNFFFSNIKNVNIVRINTKFKIPRIFWQTFILPFQLSKHKIEIFWSPTHRISPFINGKIKIYSTVHDLVCKRYPETMKFFGKILDNFYLPIALKKSNKIISVSKFTKKEIINFFPQYGQKIKVIYPGSDLKKILIKNKKKNKINYILFVGTIEPRKNILFIIKAFKKMLKTKHKKIKLYFIGQRGWGNLNLNELIRNEKINHKVKWFSDINDKKLVQFYENSDLVILPSLYEGFGLPILEALNLNKKVLYSKKSPMSEIAKNFGTSVNPNSIVSIAKGLSQALNKKPPNKNDLKKHLMFFSWKNSAKQILQIFE